MAINKYGPEITVPRAADIGNIQALAAQTRQRLARLDAAVDAINGTTGTAALTNLVRQLQAQLNQTQSTLRALSTTVSNLSGGTTSESEPTYILVQGDEVIEQVFIPTLEA